MLKARLLRGTGVAQAALKIKVSKRLADLRREFEARQGGATPPGT